LASAGAHGPDTWTEQQRRVRAYEPADVLAAVEEDAGSCMTPNEYSEALLKRLQRVMPDALNSRHVVWNDGVPSATARM
jgi:hypothetical protein